MNNQVPSASKQSKTPLTRGYKKKARTRQQLVNAAVRIYAHKGAGELALHELAQEAGVASGTVYNYFRTKEEVLNAVGIALAEELSHQVTSVCEGVTDGAERFSIGVRTFVRQAEQDPEWAGALINVVRYAEGMRSAVAESIRNDLRIGRKQGHFHYDEEDIAVGLVVSGVMSVMVGIVEGRGVKGQDAIVTKMLLQALGMDGQAATHLVNKPVPSHALQTPLRVR